MADPTLCKAVETVSGRFTSLTDKPQSGTAMPADLAAGKPSRDNLQRDATKGGYQFKEQNVTIPGTG
ncbi:hypothetical protein ACQP25_30070 [Microtetraspora malaysiensis]|uniref:hypothetical protein n=1 Tax=Microtetraspora malaysiensis TaxID=161358 RepID=UPI003D9200FC